MEPPQVPTLWLVFLMVAMEYVVSDFLGGALLYPNGQVESHWYISNHFLVRSFRIAMTNSVLHASGQRHKKKNATTKTIVKRYKTK